jgi:hypothetical protein
MFVIESGADKYSIKKQEDLSEVPNQALLNTYNELTGKSTQKFASRAKGEEQTWKAIEKAGVVPAEVANRSETTGRREPVNKAATIKRLVSENPKREGTSSHARFELYKDGMTVAAFLKKGGFLADIRWDADKGFIELVEPEEEK